MVDTPCRHLHARRLLAYRSSTYSVLSRLNSLTSCTPKNLIDFVHVFYLPRIVYFMGLVGGFV